MPIEWNPIRFRFDHHIDVKKKRMRKWQTFGAGYPKDHGQHGLVDVGDLDAALDDVEREDGRPAHHAGDAAAHDRAPDTFTVIRDLIFREDRFNYSISPVLVANS